LSALLAHSAYRISSVHADVVEDNPRRRSDPMTAARPQPAVRRVVYIVSFLGLVAAGAATVMAKHEPLADWRR
jgi:hypothetical protein